MRCAEDNVFRCDAGFLLHQLARRHGGFATDREGIETHDGHALFSIIEHRSANLWWIVDFLRDGFSVVPRKLHADIRNDFAVGETGFDLGQCEGG